MPCGTEPGARDLGRLLVDLDPRSLLRASAFRRSFPHGGRDTRERVLSDREREVERLYRTEGGRLWRAVMAYSGDREIANDAMAEAFAQVLARGEAVRDPLAWVWRSTFRIAAGELKKVRERSPVPLDDVAYEMPEPLADVLEALGRLSPNQRAAVILHDYVDLPTRQVARIMGIASATVRVHVSQARRRLRALLEDRDD
jgi:RNA polymerase sigma-70 factor (ECF subfamily)